VENEEALEDLIRNGRGDMPAVGRDWEERQMQALIAYLQEGDVLGG
jgi:mono/diheme cytochrome c family protein